jgi:hypothetical protein
VRALKLYSIKKPFLGFWDISKALGISPESARIAAHRYTKNGFLVRIKPNIFVLTEKWNNFSSENYFETANLLQVPSYVSLTTALGYYGITTQMQQNYIESISLKRTLSKEIKEITFRYSKLSEKFYSAFEKRDGFFIARPEKALLDAIYLMSLGRYALDIPALSFTGIDQGILNKLSDNYPYRVKKMLRSYGFISQA